MRRLLLIFLLFCTVQGFSQNNFRSRQTGDWNQSSSWEEFIAGTWQLTGNTPTSASGTINIQSGHIVTVTAGVTADQTTVDIGGIMAVADAVTLTLANGTGNDLTVSGTLRMLGESVLSGAGNIMTSGTIALGSLEPTGALATGTTTGNIRLASRTFVSGANISYAGTAAQFIGNGTPAVTGVNTVINNASGVSLNNTSSSLVSIFGDLVIQAGDLTVQDNNLSVNSAAGTINVIGGDLLMTSAGVARTLTARNITLNGGNIVITSGAQTTACTVNGVLTLNSGNFTINSSGFTSTLTLQDDLNLAGGSMFVNSGASNAILHVNGDIAGTTFITFSGANSHVRVNGSGALSRDFPISAPTNLASLIINRPSGTLVIPSALNVTSGVRITAGNIDANAAFTVAGNVDIIAGGTLFFEGQTLEIGSTFNTLGGYTGVLSANSSSTLRFSGSGSAGTIAFAPSGNTLGTLHLNRSGGGTLVTLNSTLNIATLVYLQDGILTNTSGLTMNSGSMITVNAAASLTGAAPAGGPYNITYEGTSSFLTGVETTGSVQDVTNLSSATVTVNTPLTVQGTLTLSSGNLVSSSSLLTMANGSTLVRQGNSATYSASGSVPAGGPYNVIYTGTTFSTGSEAGGSLNNVTSNASGTVTMTAPIVAAGTLTVASGVFTGSTFAITAGAVNNVATLNLPSSTLTLNGNLTNDGAINAGTGTVLVNAASTFGGTTIGTTTFNNITVSGTGTLTPPPTLSLTGNFINNGSFVAGSGTVVFTGAGTKTISGTTNTQFNNVTMATSASNLVIGSTSTVLGTLALNTGNLVNSGSSLQMGNASTLSRIGNTATYSGAGVAPGGGPYNLVYTGTTFSTTNEAGGSLSNVTANTSGTLTLAIPITAAATFLVSSGTVNAGANAVAASSVQNDGTFNLPSTTLTLGTGNLINNAVINAGTGTLVFNGASNLLGTTINTTNFNNITINGTGNVTSSTTLNIQGNFTNDGVFNNAGGTVVFSGTVGSKTLSGTSNTQFANLTLNKSNAGTSLTVSSTQTVTNTLTLTDGILNISSSSLVLSSGTTLNRHSNASVSTTSPGGGPWNLVYLGGSLNTGLEIPAGSLQSLTINSNSAAVVTLTTPITIVGAFTINTQAVGPTFNTGNRAISAATLVNGGIFNAPTPATLTLTGNLTNNGTFNGLAGTVLFSGNSTILGSTPVTFNHVTISGTLNRPSILSLNGNFTNNGNFSGSAGTVSFVGSTTQNLGGSTLTNFNNIDVTNANALGMRVQSNQNLVGTMTLGPGVQVDADGSSNTAIFTLLSTDDAPTFADARIATIPGTSSVTGSVTVQRFMSAADDVDRYISSPVTNAPVSQLQAFMAITGEFAGSSYPCTGCENDGPNLKYYDETVQGDINEGFHGWPPSASSPLVPGVGYDLYMWNGVTNINYAVRGPINQGTIPFTISRTDSDPPSNDDDGWNLLGNPYPSQIVWNDTDWPQSGIWTTAYVWDVNSSAYRTWDNSTDTGDLLNGVIASGQSFWVYALNAGATLSITEAAKVSTAGRFYRERSNAQTGLKMTLSHGRSFDNSFIFIKDEATEDFDHGIDAPKLIGAGERLAIASSGPSKRRAVFNYIGEDNINQTIPLFVKGEQEGSYQISFETLGNVAGLSQAYLVDTYEGTQTPVGTPYQFMIPKGGAEYSDRFHLTVREAGDLNTSEVAISAYPNPVMEELNVEIRSVRSASVVLLDNMGRLVGEVEMTYEFGNAKGKADTRAMRSGVYILRAVTDRGVATQKIVKQ